MGYYDQDYDQSRRPRGNRGGWFLAGLTGALLGALIVIIALPFLSGLGLIPGQTDVQPYLGETKPAGPEKNVNVNVNTNVTNIVNKVSSSVVGVINIQDSGGFWDSGKGNGQEAGSGSGVIYKKDGGNAFIVTNHHVIQGANQVEISLHDGTRLQAEILGSDNLTDLAVLKVKGDKIKEAATFGNSDEVKPGEPVIAIGNPLGEQFAGSVTQGIISGTERAIPVDSDGDGQPDWNAEVLQTDAAINPGNSGGALMDIDGNVIGINSMKIAQSEVEGIGLSIPANLVKPVVSDLERFGEVRRPFLGLSMRSLSDVSAYHQQETLKLPDSIKNGVVVYDVSPSSPAARAGFQQFDVIVGMDGKKIEDIFGLRKVLYTKRPGDTAKIDYYRNGKKQSASVKLVEQRTQGS
ncbi:S1C family serine protease [Metabacillus sp. GX 13764]|uniref:S1C family serine protease n=1 Tax=Metabacillus kandeliae TaxID=2900151 RepID=UPI001E5887CA|nr:S1C family serine protease [Metabacillus kandeliae]MCD7035317.1 S1C family serine protease [Metabacillus kandeliae]